MHSVLRNEALIPCDCVHAACRSRSSLHKLYFCCLGKHSQTETGFKTNFLPMKGENSITSYCIALIFKLAKIWWLVKEILVSEALGVYFPWILIASIKRWLGRWMGAWFWINWEGGEWNCAWEWWQYCSVNCWNVSISIGFFLPYPNSAPLHPNITWARGSNSLRITGYKKG